MQSETLYSALMPGLIVRSMCESLVFLLCARSAPSFYWHVSFESWVLCRQRNGFHGQEANARAFVWRDVVLPHMRYGYFLQFVVFQMVIWAQVCYRVYFAFAKSLVTKTCRFELAGMWAVQESSGHRCLWLAGGALGCWATTSAVRWWHKFAEMTLLSFRGLVMTPWRFGSARSKVSPLFEGGSGSIPRSLLWRCKSLVRPLSLNQTLWGMVLLWCLIL